MKYPKGPGYPGDLDRRIATGKARIAATELMFPLGADANGIPSGIPYAPVWKYSEAMLAEKAWLLTKVSLRHCQAQAAANEKAASERLWTEENA